MFLAFVEEAVIPMMPRRALHRFARSGCFLASRKRRCASRRGSQPFRLNDGAKGQVRVEVLAPSDTRALWLTEFGVSLAAAGRCSKVRWYNVYAPREKRTTARAIHDRDSGGRPVFTLCVIGLSLRRLRKADRIPIRATGRHLRDGHVPQRWPYCAYCRRLSRTYLAVSVPTEASWWVCPACIS